MRINRIVITALCLCALSLSTQAGTDEDPTSVIRALYAADQPWAQKSLDLGDKQTLARYFAPPLITLFLRLDDAAKHCSGDDVCGFDFEPFYDTQDFDDRPDIKLRIESLTPTQEQRYAVYFTVIKSEGEHRLEYNLVRTQSGWRIAEILYPEAGDDRALTAMIKNLIKEAHSSKQGTTTWLRANK
jgi:hypothetical protein